MTKELSRYPRALSENVNSELINRLYESGGRLSIDLIVYLANYQMKNLFLHQVDQIKRWSSKRLT